MLAHSLSSQAAFIGIRSTFYRIASIFGQGVLVLIAGLIENQTGNIPLSWQPTLGVAAVIFCAITLYHLFFPPKARCRQTAHQQRRAVPNPTGQNWRSRLSPSSRNPVACFCHRFHVALQTARRISHQTVPAVPGPFPRKAAGLGLETDIVGLVYGTFGVIALLLGGIVAASTPSRVGLKTVVVADGGIHHAALPRLCLSCHFPAVEHRRHQHRRLWEQFRIRFRLHRLHAL